MLDIVYFLNSLAFTQHN